jgi:hypothetical protein
MTSETTTETTYSEEDYRKAREWERARRAKARARVDELLLPTEGEVFSEVCPPLIAGWGYRRRVLVVTRRQEIAVRRIFEEMLEGERTELKSYDFAVVGRKLAVYVTTGLIGDEGTMAEVLCRDRIAVYVGPRGGLEARNGRLVYRGYKALIYGKTR